MKKSVVFVVMLILLISFVSAKSGNMKLLAVSNVESNPTGSVANLKLEIEEGSGRVFMDSFPLSKIDTQISTRFAKEVACNFIEKDCNDYDFFYTIRANSALIGGPSAGAAITVLTIAVLEDLTLDESVSITGTINTGGIIGPVGGILAKSESAAKAGIKKVLIPKYTSINITNITKQEDEFEIEIVEVSELSEAVFYFTGKDYSNHDEVNISSSYIETMKGISEGLCQRSEDLSLKLYDVDENVTALNLLDKGIKALINEQFYSAASYCFGAGLNLRNKMLSEEHLSKTQILDKISETQEDITDFRSYIEKQPQKTLTDLETYMAVTDRILESEERLTIAKENLEMNNTNASVFQVAYAIERLNSAKSWSIFFGTPGREFVFNKEVMDESCLKKINEVEERIQYVDLYLPTTTKDARKAIDKAYLDYNDGNPELCLYKASITKARINLILNSLSIDPDFTKNVIQDRLKIVKSLIAKQNQKGIFPMVAYSYYEYANSLSETDNYSALLYLEYALELGNLDIYFEKKSFDFPKIPKEDYLVFLIGVCVGVLVTLTLTRKKKGKKDTKKKK